MNDLALLIVGAILAIIGGGISEEIRAWLERRRELKSIKISIADELSEMETTLSTMHEVWEKTKVFHPSYVAALLSNTSAFDNLRSRLFLHKDQGLRKEIVTFYKKLKDTAQKSEGKLGTLADTPDAIEEQKGYMASFQALGVEAKKIREKLEA